MGLIDLSIKGGAVAILIITDEYELYFPNSMKKVYQIPVFVGSKSNRSFYSIGDRKFRFDGNDDVWRS